MSCSRSKRAAAIAATTALGLSAGLVTTIQAPAEAAEFSLNRMIQAIDAELGNGNVVGYSFSIAKDGKVLYTNGHGKARNNADGNVPMGGKTRMDIMSATKNFTAVSILDLLERNQLDPDAKAAPYLPKTWKRDATWKQLTFRQLLTHTSGLKQQPVDADFTKAERDAWGTLNKGVRFAMTKPLVVPSPYKYTNMNYAVLRIALVGLWRKVAPASKLPSIRYYRSGFVARNYLNQRFFTPMGIHPAACETSNPNKAALAYDIANPSKPGKLIALKGEDLQACAGHRGLWVSAVDMTKFQMNVQNLNHVSRQVRAWQNSGLLGWEPGSNNGYYWHGGDAVGKYQIHTCIAAFNENVQVALITNSGNKTGRRPCRVLIDSWKKGAGIL
jgi:CubicO group peptidase (beta-lactamase class C family)